jgi:hypothetical protein
VAATKELFMSFRNIIMALTAAVIVAQSGCRAIQSHEVRDLITREGEKIDAAQVNIHQYHLDTQKRIDYLKASIADLNTSIKMLQASEAKHAIIAGAHQNIGTKKGLDAWSVSYVIAKTYLSEYQGLEQAVIKQFDDDMCAILEAVNRIEDSWANLATIHTQIERYSKKSGFASVDPQFVGALVERVPGGSDRLAQVLDRSRTVNDALQEALTYPFLQRPALERTRALTVDLMDLLERMKQ